MNMAVGPVVPWDSVSIALTKVKPYSFSIQQVQLEGGGGDAQSILKRPASLVVPNFPVPFFVDFSASSSSSAL
jgi:hypothetical protein